jgi:signal peptidase I
MNRKSLLRTFWREWIRGFALPVLLITAAKSAIADMNPVPTGSMKPTVLEGDVVWVNKLAYDCKVPFTLWRVAEWADPQSGEIVVCFSPEDGKRLLKRVVGVPGDTVELRNETLFLNAIMITPRKRALRNFGPVTVPEGSYYMLGDNRDDSHDSRFFGFVPRREIVGRATAVVASVDLKRYGMPRFERFFSSLN